MAFTADNMDVYFEHSEMIDLRRARIERLFLFIKTALDKKQTDDSGPEQEFGSFPVMGTNYVLSCKRVRIGSGNYHRISFYVMESDAKATVYISGGTKLPDALVTPIYEILLQVVNHFSPLLPELKSEIQNFMALVWIF